jgi:hypothetical protein
MFAFFKSACNMLKRVSWCDVDIYYQLVDAYEDRRSIWIVHAADRERFRRRINEASLMLNPVLKKQRQRQCDALFCVETAENSESKLSVCCCM